MPGKHTVRPLPAHGKVRPLEMPDRDLQHRLLRAVVNGKRAVDLGYFDIAHHAEPQKRAFDRHLLLSFSAFNLSVFGRLIAPVPQVGQRLFDGLVTLFGDAAFV